jgi:RNA polymerase sigma factor (TIGR02999 family)
MSAACGQGYFPAPINLFPAMSEVTVLLTAIEQGDIHAAEQLLPLVYDELRRLAASRIGRERTPQTLQATALVHEAFLRLVDTSTIQQWKTRGHFFGAAAEAMRRILIEKARRKERIKHGGDVVREDLDLLEIEAPSPREDLIAIDAALTKLQAVDATAAELVQLRYFAGLSIAESAAAMDISPRTADRIWVFAKAWLHREVS